MITQKAADILRQVAARIVAEPDRYDQKEYKPCNEVTHTCGTVGCIAGWTVLITDGLEEYNKLDDHGIERRAEKILGLTDYQPYSLFLTFTNKPAGTPENAQAGVQIINNFIEQEGISADQESN